MKSELLKATMVAIALAIIAICISFLFAGCASVEPFYTALPPDSTPIIIPTGKTSLRASAAALPAPVGNGQIRLAWDWYEDTNGAVLSNGIISSVVMWGSVSKTYTQQLTVPFPAQSCIVTGIPDGSVFYACMAAKDSNGVLSLPSDEIFTPVVTTNLINPPTIYFGGQNMLCIQTSTNVVYWTDYTSLVPATNPAQLFRVKITHQ